MAGVENFDPVPFDDGEEVVFNNDPIPEGEYTLKLVGAKGGKYGTGNPKITWELMVTEGESEGRRLWHDTPTTGKGVGITKAVVKALGYDWDEWFTSVDRVLGPEALASLIGNDGRAKVTINVPNDETLEKYPNAKPRNEIKRWFN